MSEPYITPKTQFHVTLAGVGTILVAVVGGTLFVSDKVNTLSNVVIEQGRQNERLVILEQKITRMDERGQRIAQAVKVDP